MDQLQQDLRWVLWDLEFERLDTEKDADSIIAPPTELAEEQRRTLDRLSRCDSTVEPRAWRPPFALLVELHRPRGRVT